MTPEEIREIGLKVAHCNGSHRCSERPHAHCLLRTGLEYCREAEVLLVDTQRLVSDTGFKPTIDQCADMAAHIIAVLALSYPQWPVNRVQFVRWGQAK